MGKKILLADDSLTIQKVVELTLAGMDYELTCVSNGQKALDSLQNSLPDLILADVVMPEKNGYEVCEAVKSNPATAGIPVLLLSGTFEPFDRDRADRLGADRVVSKPFHGPHLLDQIEALLTGAAVDSAAESAASEDGPFGTVFLDDTIPTSGAAQRNESPARAKEWKQGAPAGAGSSIAEAERGVAEGFSGGPVFLPLTDPRAATAKAETRNPVEEAPASERPPAGHPGEGAGLEEISAEEAAAFFDGPAAMASPASAAPDASGLTPEQIERIADLVVAKLSDRVLREIAWEVVPDVAEMVVKRRIEELEGGVE